MYKAIWLPIATFEGRVPKDQSLREESWHIWRRNCNLNASGAQSWDAQDRRQREGELITPKRRQHSMIKKVMDRARQEQEMTKEERMDKTKRRKENEKPALQGRGRLCCTTARVARRPLKMTSRFQDLCVVQELRRMNDVQFNQLMEARYAVLDKVNKSIFLSNIKKIVENDPNRIFVAMSVRAAVVSAPNAKRIVTKQVSK